MAVSDELVSSLRAKGASLVGFADLRGLPEDGREGLPFGISVGVALDPGIIAQISDGPTSGYKEEYERVNARLDSLGQMAAKLLVGNGFTAAFHPSTDGYDLVSLSRPLPHKTVATRAGLGWIGKSALLVTREFGPALRLTSILTDAELPAGRPVDASQCGKCADCVYKCPAHAPSGKTWQAGMKREAFFDAFACEKNARAMMLARVGIDYPICGMCIAACPWARRYLERVSRTR